MNIVYSTFLISSSFDPVRFILHNFYIFLIAILFIDICDHPSPLGVSSSAGYLDFRFSSRSREYLECSRKLICTLVLIGVLIEEMKSEGMGMFESGIKQMMKTPSLVDLCVQTAIDNLRYLGDVGETDLHLLDRILPHCTLEQLKQVEDSTEGRYLSPVTDKLWKKFYETEFGAKSVNLVVERMKCKSVSFEWKQLYEAKLKDVEKAQQKSFDRIKQLYKKEDARKQSRQVQICTKVPPSSNKRNFCGGWGPGSSIGNSKSSLMKKSKVDFLKSQEVKNLTAMKRNAVQRNNSPLSIKKPSGFSVISTASTSRDIKPLPRRC